MFLKSVYLFYGYPHTMNGSWDQQISQNIALSPEQPAPNNTNWLCINIIFLMVSLLVVIFNNIALGLKIYLLIYKSPNS